MSSFFSERFFVVAILTFSTERFSVEEPFKGIIIDRKPSKVASRVHISKNHDLIIVRSMASILLQLALFICFCLKILKTSFF